MTEYERFEARFVPEPNTGCWLWHGASNPAGYGIFSRRGAHRYSYEVHKGPIPSGLVIDHLCRTPCCVSPDHLEAVTQGENLSRSPPKRRKALLPACPKGHLWADGDFSVRRDTGNRVCLACKRAWTRSFDVNNAKRSAAWREKRKVVSNPQADGEGSVQLPPDPPYQPSTP